MGRLTTSGNLTTADRSNAIVPLSNLLVDHSQEEGGILFVGISVMVEGWAWVVGGEGGGVSVGVVRDVVRVFAVSES